MATPCLRNVAPELVTEMQSLLMEQGEHDLATQVVKLAIVELCSCGDSFCSTFHTVERSNSPRGLGHRTIALRPQRGILNVDVVGPDIVGIEILYRDEFRTNIRAAVA